MASHSHIRSLEHPAAHPALSERIRAQQAKIIHLWEQRVRDSLDSAKRQDRLQLQDSLPRFIDNLSRSVGPEPQDSESHLRTVEAISRDHGEQRAQLNFNLDEVLREYIILREVLFEVLEEKVPLAQSDRDRIFGAIQSGMQFAVHHFVQTQRAKEEEWSRHLQAEQRWFEAVLDWMPIPTCLIEPTTGEIKFYNKAAKSAPFLAPRKLPSEEQNEYYATDLEGNRISLHQMPRLRIAQGEVLSNFEMTWHTPRGTYAVSITGTLMPEMHGRPAFAIMSFQDISARRQMERERADLLEREKKARLDAESYAHRLHDVQAITEIALSRSGSLDELLREVLGYLRMTFAADTLALLMVTEDGSSLEVLAAQGLEESIVRKVRIPKGDGIAGKILATGTSVIVDDLRDVEVASPILRERGIHCLMGVPLRTKERTIGVIHVGRFAARHFVQSDLEFLELIADRIAIVIDNAALYNQVRGTVRKLEEEKGIREQFVAMLTHDLRGPLTAAKASVGLLRRHPERADLRERMLARIDQSIDRADRMIQDMLDSSRIRAGQRLPIQPVECDLREVAGELIEELALAHGERFVLRAPDSLLVRLDCGGMRRLLENLCTNGVKYGDPTAPITVTLAERDGGLEISVHNQGPPIPPDYQPGLFDPFRRIVHAGAHETRGWGLGLALVRAIAEAHGGGVTVRSSAEEGTTFTVSLPTSLRFT